MCWTQRFIATFVVLTGVTMKGRIMAAILTWIKLLCTASDKPSNANPLVTHSNTPTPAQTGVIFNSVIFGLLKAASGRRSGRLEGRDINRQLSSVFSTAACCLDGWLSAGVTAAVEPGGWWHWKSRPGPFEDSFQRISLPFKKLATATVQRNQWGAIRGCCQFPRNAAFRLSDSPSSSRDYKTQQQVTFTQVLHLTVGR